MARYRYDKETGELYEVKERDYSQSLGVMVRGDLPAYESPLGRYMVDGRRARREDLARNNCREVDPSEFKPSWRSAAEKAAIAADQTRSRVAFGQEQARLARGMTTVKE